MVISRTKFPVTHEDIVRIFCHAGLGEAKNIRVLGAGEFNSAFSVEAGERTYALKVGANNAAVQIYEQDMMKSEVHWYQVIAQHTDLRVPKVYFSDFTKTVIPTNYFIMEFIPGTQKGECQFTPGEKFGYIQSGLYDTWPQALAHIVENLQLDARKLGQTLPRAEKLLSLIARYSQVLEKAPCRLISFDAWDGNFISVSDDPENPELVWIDPERCLWGDPMLDFVTMELGAWKLAEKRSSIAAYNSLAEFPVTPTREEEIRYAFGLCYLATIMECERFYRYTPDLPLWQRSIEFSDLLYELGFSMLE